MNAEHEHLCETLRISNRINLFLLDAITPQAMTAKPVAMTGRSVREMFAHLHAVRLQWLEPLTPQVAASVGKLPLKTAADKDALTHERLRAALATSADALANVLLERLTSGKTGALKPTPAAFVGYLLAHESYHRGEICMVLTQNGHKLDDSVLYGIWDWGKFA